MPDGPIDGVLLIPEESRFSSAVSESLASLALGPIAPPPDIGDAVDRSVDSFNEAAYAWAFADVARAVQSGEWATAHQHYLTHGRDERRLEDHRYISAASGKSSNDVDCLDFGCSIDELFVGESGLCFVIGWIADTDVPLTGLAVMGSGKLLASSFSWARCRRPDAEAAIGSAPGKLLGFWALLKMSPAHRPALRDGCRVLARVGERTCRFPMTPKLTGDLRLRDLIFEYFAGASYFGNRHIESFIQLEQGLGATLIEFNVESSRRIMAGSFVFRYGRQHRRFVGSVIVCLYGKVEFLFLQSAMFSAGGDWSDYEFIYVSNSPELAESLQKEAAIAHRVYGIDITLVLLPDNAGFGGANNVAASYARSDRLLVVNPDVFPRQGDWARAHTDLLRSLPAAHTTIFGVPLFYDDGSLMHGGMYFEMDEGWSVHAKGVDRRRMVRVEHYGKGAPCNDGTYVQAREVPAVTGAFISVDRGWFEALGGFSLQYVFGHYEDADICLASSSRGRPVWLHNIPFWHLEGKGSVRRLAHEGGSLINRWHFTRIWGDLIERGHLRYEPVL